MLNQPRRWMSPSLEFCAHSARCRPPTWRCTHNGRASCKCPQWSRRPWWAGSRRTAGDGMCPRWTSSARRAWTIVWTSNCRSDVRLWARQIGNDKILRHNILFYIDRSCNVRLVNADRDAHQHVLRSLHHASVDLQQVRALQRFKAEIGVEEVAVVNDHGVQPLNILHKNNTFPAE